MRAECLHRGRMTGDDAHDVGTGLTRLGPDRSSALRRFDEAREGLRMTGKIREGLRIVARARP